jgi:hypothetical protein
MNQRHRYKRNFRPFPLLILIAGLIMGGVVMLLWNTLLPAILGTKTISYWQAVGLLALCRLLFGNFGGRMGGPREHWNKQQDQEGAEDENQRFGGSHWKGRWMNMTREERLKFREEIRRRCMKPPGKE